LVHLTYQVVSYIRLLMCKYAMQCDCHEDWGICIWFVI
jgi:hypothetical protein